MLTATDSATVTITNVPADIATRKIAIRSSIFEPGGNVDYRLGVQNVSAVDTVTITSLDDNLAGVPAGDCVTPFTLLPGGTYDCTYPGAVGGNAGDARTNTVTVSGTSDDGEAVSDRAAATVFILGAEPTLEVRKLALPPVALDTGSPVIFRVAVLNTSPSQDPVTLTSLVDDMFGDLDGVGTCSLPQTLQPVPSVDSLYTCSFTTNLSGPAGTTHTNVVTASGTDDEGTPVQATDDAVVTFANPLPDADPSLGLFKFASPTEVPETGGDVTFTLLLVNSAETANPDLDLTVTSLVDDIYGDLAGKVDCALPLALPVGQVAECRFTETVNGQVGDVIVDTVTADAVDQLARPVSAMAQASVTITDIPSSIDVVKTATPTTFVEPGQDVVFDVEVINTSQVDTVTIDTLVDSVYGDLVAGGLCPAPPPLAPGEAYACSFTVFVDLAPGVTELNTVLAVGVDDDGQPVQGTGQASVTVSDSPASLSVRKTATPGAVSAEGAPVEFEFTVTNTSEADTIVLDMLNDSTFGNLDGRGDCSVPQTLAPGQEYRCAFEAQVTGVPGQTHRNVVRASGTSDDGDPVSVEDNAIVRLLRDVAVPVNGPIGLALLVLLMVALAAWQVRCARR